jgi:hypothetical protein
VLTIVIVLAVATIATWVTVLVNASAGSGGAACPAATAGPPAGTVLASDALDGVAPVAATGAKVRVLNAGGQRGQANLVAAQLGDLGFVQAAPPENDPLFPKGGMTCTGQIRFGPAGEAAASTVALAVPCAELVRDARTGDSVDIAVGTGFGDVNPTKSVRDVLEELASGGADPAVDQATLTAARKSRC